MDGSGGNGYGPGSRDNRPTYGSARGYFDGDNVAPGGLPPANHLGPPPGHGSGPDTDEEDDSSKDGSLKGSTSGDMSGNGATDAEGVWSPDIEQSFQEALAIYPPCGRRKIILSDEGKMYGRNELIARYIKLRTGKTRTRKQVSSHIQVLARRKAREVQAKMKDQVAKDKALSSLTQAQIASLQNIQNAKATGVPGHPHGPGVVPPPHHVATAAAGLAALGLAAPPVAPYTPSHFWQSAGGAEDVKPFGEMKGFNGQATTGALQSLTNGNLGSVNNNNNGHPWEGRSISSHKLRLTDFTGFMEHPASSGSPAAIDKHIFVQIDGSQASFADPMLEDIDIRVISDKFPGNKGGLKELYDKGPQDAFYLVKFWADLNIPASMADDGPGSGAFYGVTSQFESQENIVLSCATKVCSFGKQVVEKLETEYSSYQNGRFVFRLDRSQMCEYMVNFIHKLKDLPEKYMMNSVLENFTILQVLTNKDTNETLLCIAFVFEVSVSEHGAQHHIYRLTKPPESN